MRASWRSLQQEQAVFTTSIDERDIATRPEPLARQGSHDIR